MPFGAHEVMQTQEILSEKVNLINHFSLYAGQVQDVQLKNMLDRHIRSAMESYNTLVSYTHDYAAADQMVPLDSTQPVYTNPVQYGLRQPAPQSPQLGLSFLTDRQAAEAMLIAHKNSAKHHIAAALECADSNVRQMMVNGALRCTSQAYEVFQYMNQKGWYQVATMEDDTAKRLLHRFVAVGTQHQNTSRIPVYQQAGQPQVENQASPASEYPVQ